MDEEIDEGIDEGIDEDILSSEKNIPEQIDTEGSPPDEDIIQDNEEDELDDIDFESSRDSLIKDKIKKEIKTDSGGTKLVINIKLDELIDVVMRKLTKSKTRKKDVADDSIDEKPKKKRTKKKQKKPKKPTKKKKKKKKKKNFSVKKKKNETKLDKDKESSILDDYF